MIEPTTTCSINFSSNEFKMGFLLAEEFSTEENSFPFISFEARVSRNFILRYAACKSFYWEAIIFSLDWCFCAPNLGAFIIIFHMKILSEELNCASKIYYT